MKIRTLEGISTAIIVALTPITLMFVYEVIPFNRWSVFALITASNLAWAIDSLASSKLSLKMAKTMEAVRKSAADDRKNIWSFIMSTTTSKDSIKHEGRIMKMGGDKK